MHKLYDYLCDELKAVEDKVAGGKSLSMQELQYADTLAHFKKNLLSADAMTDGELVQENGRSGYYPMADGGQSYYSRRGSYARGGGNQRRNANGRYSRENGYSMGTEDMVTELRALMDEAPDDQTKKEFQRFISRLEQM